MKSKVSKKDRKLARECKDEVREAEVCCRTVSYCDCCGCYDYLYCC